MMLVFTDGDNFSQLKTVCVTALLMHSARYKVCQQDKHCSLYSMKKTNLNYLNST